MDDAEKAANEVIRKEQRKLLPFARAIYNQLSETLRIKLNRAINLNDEEDCEATMRLQYLVTQHPAIFRLACAVSELMLSLSSFLSEKRQKTLTGKLGLNGFETWLDGKPLRSIPRQYFVGRIISAANIDEHIADAVWAGFVRAVFELKTSLPEGLLITDVTATIELGEGSP